MKNPLLIDFPTEITTERLCIRAPRPGDGKEVNAAINESMNELKPWMPFAQKPPTLEETEANIRQSCAKFILREDLRLLIFNRKKGHFIGSTGFHRMDWDVPKVEIGYWISTKYAGKGYMTEAVEALTLFAVKEFGAKRVEIRCDPENIRSRRIPEKLGFILEGVLRQDDVSADGMSLRNTCVFSKIF
ncbi:GNAT family N-acetyltransferase [Metabacillus dongyingensis]|uniref:GNAT family N-acetyltransferase n=1 Tax=Metabacillus dongyingensis TaxID=2874282 RepID=UPI001CBF277D|nr:GNAT family N-acetyltransferase [Metabacillus dongyingensis]UAL50903.1 GNAT family N-acetyltransferase [Metabacillus dongyingensis]